MATNSPWHPELLARYNTVKEKLADWDARYTALAAATNALADDARSRAMAAHPTDADAAIDMVLNDPALCANLDAKQAILDEAAADLNRSWPTAFAGPYVGPYQWAPRPGWSEPWRYDRSRDPNWRPFPRK